MSAQDVRNEIIRDNLPKLIKELTGFHNDDENLRHCEHFAWSIVRNHRNLSTNSHEVRRKIDGIKEKFTVDNCGEYAKYLGRLCDEIIQHPLCIDHYEVDVHWSMLDFLLTLAYNPTGALRRNKHQIDISGQQLAIENNLNESEKQNESDYWKKILKEDFIEVEKLNSSDSELSDWSEHDNNGDDNTKGLSEDSSKKKHNNKKEESKSIVASLQHFTNIKPPEKQKHFTIFDSANSKERLMKTVQHSWWLESTKTMHSGVIESQRAEANFAAIYNRHLTETSNYLIRFEEPSTATEHCLLREILWMFQTPQKCKFFSISKSNEIKVRKNVSIPSLSVNGLAIYLESNFLPQIRMMHTLVKFIDSIYLCADFTPPNTVECYAANLRLLLEPIWKKLLEYEERLIVSRDFEINTIISLHACLRESFASLTNLHDLHQQVTLNPRQYPAHISSAYLLTSLIHCSRNASNATEANLAISLFLAAVKMFCIIIDTWWTEGRLDDWHHEFIIERANCSDQTICVRQFCKNKELAFFVPTNISKIITENSFFRILLDHSLEAGCTLNLLYEINRISDLRNQCDAIEGKLYDVFIDEIMLHVRTLQSELKTDKNVNLIDTAETVDAINVTKQNSRSESTMKNEKILDNLTTTDEFLLLAFTSNMEEQEEKPQQTDEGDRVDGIESASVCDLNALHLFELFEKTHDCILPLEEVILSAISRILKKRIAFANSFVIQLYRKEFGILQHLQNIRKVLLLEASDLMHQFYDKLFKQIECGQPWANHFLLTMQLDDIICAKFPDMSSLFRVEINSPFRCETRKVFEAVDELTISYNFNRELSHIITEDDVQDYNKVFRFLLKVKWGITTLENLQFPRFHKRRLSYAPFEMIDLLMRRLEQLRFWMIYAIQSIHFHLMTHVLQSMGEQLDEKIEKCTNLKEMKMVHRSYVSTVCEHCFLVDSFNAVKLGVEQLLNLTFILRLEWNSCIKHIESNHPLAIVDANGDSGSEDSDHDYVANSQVDAIELTYIRCHQYLANKLNNEVYLNQNTFLTGLSAAFNTSLPY